MLPSFIIVLLLDAIAVDRGLLLALVGFTTRIAAPARCPLEPRDERRAACACCERAICCAE